MHRALKFRNLLQEFSVPLLTGVITAVIFANISAASYNDLVYGQHIGPLSLHFLSNEIFMVLFFAMATIEVTKGFLPGGDLNPPNKAFNTLLATLGGVVGPALVFLSLTAFLGESHLSRGWGIPTATDIALAWLFGRLVLGANHPGIAYLLLLAIADDAIGLVIIALFYPDPVNQIAPLWLLLTASGMGLAYAFRRLKIENYWPYVIIAGAISWIGLFMAHVHPALALSFVVPFIPHKNKVHGHLFEEDVCDKSPLAMFEHEWKVIMDFGLFFFGFANAGVEFSQTGPVTWIVFSSLLIGKTFGVFLLGLMGKFIGAPLPRGMGLKDLLVVGIIAGIGFTVAIFVSGEAFVDPLLKSQAKMGAMLSIFAGLIAFIVSKILRIKKFA